jgi:hypothetical protein
VHIARPLVVAPIAEVDALPPCRAPLRVVAAVQSDRPSESFALLADGAGRSSTDVRPGTPIGHGVVDSIGWSPTWGAYVVVVAHGARPCFFGESTPPTSSEPATTTATASPTPQRGGPLDRLVASGIERVGPNHFAVQRGLLRRLAADPDGIARTIRAVPTGDGQHITGIRIGAAPGSSLLGQLGLRDGDVLAAVNGRALDGPDHWLEAYMMLQSAEHVALSVLRDGRPMQIDADIR